MNERPPDFLQFEGGVIERIPQGSRETNVPGTPLVSNRSYRRGWGGPWPPPQRMGVAVGHQAGMVSIFDPDDLLAGSTLEEVEDVAEVTIYRRESASTLPDDFDSAHVARGAVYRPEEDE